MSTKMPRSSTAVIHATQPAPNYAALLEDTPVHQLLLEKKNAIPLVAVPATTSIEDVFDCLLGQDVTSVPIYTTQDNSTNISYIGFISAYDLLVYLSDDLDLGEEAVDWIGNAPNDTTASRLTSALQQPVLSVVNRLGLGAKVLTISPSDSVQTLLKLLTQHGQHHAIVQLDTDANQKHTASYPLPCVITQTDLGRFLAQNFHQLGNVLDLSVKQAAERRPIPHLPVTVQVNTTAGAVFRRLSDLLASNRAPNEGGGAIAVVDDLGGVVAECSAAELRGLNPNRISELRRPILVYLRERAGGMLPRPFICWPNFTLTQCLAGMVRLGVRRAWLVNDSGVLKRVVTLSDILRLFV
ncbi:hypothetical protein BDF19DRAFT_426449 [Syncephalis fuscata]|nr:hypothetical protein BDF19DRAFT_426449 [Syncephalis fuscata]